MAPSNKGIDKLQATNDSENVFIPEPGFIRLNEPETMPFFRLPPSQYYFTPQEEEEEECPTESIVVNEQVEVDSSDVALDQILDEEIEEDFDLIVDVILFEENENAKKSKN